MDERTILITGANRGLGFEVARQLARGGDRVILTARDPDKGKRAVARLSEEGLVARVLECDLEDPATWKSLQRQLVVDRVTVDVIIHNAGISLEGFDADVARKTLEVNLFGVLGLNDVLVPKIALGGHVLMVSSELGGLGAFGTGVRNRLSDPALDRDALVDLMESFVEDVGLGRHARAGWPSSAYAVSKAGLNAATRVLSKELAERHIAVNAVCPGWVRTDMGGPDAERTVEAGARSIVSATRLPGRPTGGFFKDGRRIDW